MAQAGRLNVERLRELARAGAEVALERIRAEIVALERAFPELAEPQRRQRVVKTATERVRTMSADARRAMSIRMRRYWAERRRAQVEAARKAKTKTDARS